MKVIDLTGNNRGVLGFHVDRNPDGTVSARFEVSSAVGIGAPGTLVSPDVPTITELQIKFDKTDSISAFIQTLASGGNKMAFAIMQEQVRKDAIAKALKDEDKAAKQEALKGRIEQMAKELSALQGEYAELQD
ncbi:MAG: hypothetical protein ACRC6V_05735 [Bacteroidales bacterium]